MECLLRFKRIPWVLLSALIVLLSACEEENMMPLDNSLRVLITSIDGERIVAPVDGTVNEPVLELLFSHSLN